MHSVIVASGLILWLVHTEGASVDKIVHQAVYKFMFSSLYERIDRLEKHALTGAQVLKGAPLISNTVMLYYS